MERMQKQKKPFQSYLLIIFILSTLDLITEGYATLSNPTPDGMYEPFILVAECYGFEDEGFEYSLPYAIEQTADNNKKLSAIIPATAEDKYFCPEISEENRTKLLKNTNEGCPAIKNCLFEKKFGEDEPKLCAEEPTPWLTTQNETGLFQSMSIECNRNGYNFLTFSYNECRTIEEFLSAIENAGSSHSSCPVRAVHPMYDICYNSKTKVVLWTRHQILTPMLLNDPTIRGTMKNEDIVNLDSINTSAYGIPFLYGNFSKLLEKYRKELDKGNGSFMVEYLVPMKHMALQYWKNSTHHVINTALLREKFHPLMQVINEGIMKASIRIFTQTGQNLHIFTKVETISEKNKDIDNLWLKFIYNERQKSAALIYLYDSLQSPLQKAPCGTYIPCRFEKWSELTKVEEDIAKYAGCCNFKSEEAKEYFHVDLKIKFTFNIRDVILNYNEEDTKLDFLNDQQMESINSQQEEKDTASSGSEKQYSDDDDYLDSENNDIRGYSQKPESLTISVDSETETHEEKKNARHDNSEEENNELPHPKKPKTTEQEQ